MSQDRKVNSPSDFNFPPDVESLLRGAMPEDVVLDRNVLLYQSGFAAGANSRRLHFVWPSAAAALAVVCIGLTAALVAEMRAVKSAQFEIAILRAAQNVAITNNGEREPANKTEAIAPSDSPTRVFLNNQRFRDWTRLASSTSLGSGQLTVAGWEQKPFAPNSKAASAVQPDTGARRPSTYRELLKRYEEG